MYNYLCQQSDLSSWARITYLNIHSTGKLYGGRHVFPVLKKLWTAKRDTKHYVVLSSKAKHVFTRSQLGCVTERELSESARHCPRKFESQRCMLKDFFTFQRLFKSVAFPHRLNTPRQRRRVTSLLESVEILNDVGKESIFWKWGSCPSGPP